MLLDGHRPRSPSDPRRPRRRLAVALAVAVPVAVLSAPAASYVTALTAPGSADWQTTSVEWVRDHGGGPLVDTVENWWYAHNRPTGAVPAAGTLPTDDGPAGPPAAGGAARPATAQPATAQPPALPLLAGQAGPGPRGRMGAEPGRRGHSGALQRLLPAERRLSEPDRRRRLDEPGPHQHAPVRRHRRTRPRDDAGRRPGPARPPQPAGGRVQLRMEDGRQPRRLLRGRKVPGAAAGRGGLAGHRQRRGGSRSAGGVATSVSARTSPPSARTCN